MSTPIIPGRDPRDAGARQSIAPPGPSPAPVPTAARGPAVVAPESGRPGGRRVFELTTPLGKDRLVFRRLRGREELSRLSEFDLSAREQSIGEFNVSFLDSMLISHELLTDPSATIGGDGEEMGGQDMAAMRDDMDDGDMDDDD